MTAPDSDAKSALRMKVARMNMSAERDCVPSGRVRSRYIICSTPRSGSTLLSDYLLASGMAGAPYDYFNESHLAAFSERFGRPVADLGTFMAQIEEFRTSAQGVFGMKAHYRQTAALLRTPDLMTQFLRRFGKIIRIIRRDKVAQAVSAYKALESGFWTHRHEELSETVPPAPAYNAARIAECLSQGFSEEQGWLAALRLAGQDAITVAYEDLVSDPDRTLAAVFSYLEIPAFLPIRLQPSLRRQADRSNARYRAQFLADIEGKPA